MATRCHDLSRLFHIWMRDVPKPWIYTHWNPIFLKLIYRFSQSFSNFFSFIFIQRTIQLRPGKCPWTKVDFNFKLLSSNFNIVSLYFVIMSLIFVIVAILFVLPYRRVVNHKSNFVLCHSFSHIWHPISSASLRLINRSLLVSTFVLVIVFYLFTLFWDAQRCFICLPSSYLSCQLRNKNWRKNYCTNTYILIHSSVFIFYTYFVLFYFLFIFFFC